MRVEVKSPDREGKQWRAYAERHVRFLFRRLGLVVSKVRIELDDANGPPPGVDKRVRAQLQLRDGRMARVDATARHWELAVETATHRLRTAVLEHLQTPMPARQR